MLDAGDRLAYKARMIRHTLSQTFSRTFRPVVDDAIHACACVELKWIVERGEV